MFKLDIDKVHELHEKYRFQPPLLDAGGIDAPCIADYEISVAKAVAVDVADDTGVVMTVKVPHSVQDDRYLSLRRPWSFIDLDYVVINPDPNLNDGQDGLLIEDLPASYEKAFNTVILVSVMEHVNNPYVVSDALFEILKPGGYLFNSVPFLFPYHPSPEDNWRFSPVALRRIHEQSGFQVLESDWHVNYSSKAGIGDSNPANAGAPQAILACFALAQRPKENLCR